jgi:hypothetical protein
VLYSAVIVEFPGATAVIRPLVVLLNLATFVFEEYQLTEEVMTFVLPSL